MSNPMLKIIAKAFLFALCVAGAFGSFFILFSIATILLVSGDGSAPWVTDFTVGILEGTGQLLGVKDKPLIPAAIFWSTIVFVLVFTYWLARPLKTNQINKGD